MAAFYPFRFRSLRAGHAFRSSGIVYLKGLLVGLLLLMVAVRPALAAIQFDVFVGYDGVVPEAAWFPVVCEIKNDGPAFSGVVELTGGALNQGHVHRTEVELPTGTLKRLVIPVFSTSRGFNTSWDVRLLDDRGKVRSEQVGLRANKHVGSRTPLIGSLARTPSGAPVIAPVRPQSIDLQPTSARLLPTLFPDNALVLEGLQVLYLNSERAADLKDHQVQALLAWLYGGGHLIVAIEQINDITASQWLKNLLPIEPKEIQKLSRHVELQEWLQGPNWPSFRRLADSSVANDPQFKRRFGLQQPGGVTTTRPEISASADRPFADLADDMTFEAADLQVAEGTLRGGRVLVGGKGTAGEVPLIVTTSRGLGRVTTLLFSPEREPVRSWKNLGVFWAKLAEVPGDWYVIADHNQVGGRSSDGVFGAMIDSRQVHKLPIEWLLLLLIVYLIVIGPLDQFWLKKINRPMLTWITFPCYVVLFSLLIYFIGYKLRAGESEWNELNLVDVLLNGERAELRGRTYASVYSPSNQRYLLASPQKFATLRPEFVGSWDGGQSTEKATIWQTGDGFKAEIFVPVWTSQLFVSDWWQTAPVPLMASVQANGESWQVKVENHTDQKFSNAQMAIEDYLMPLGDLAPGETKTVTVNKGQGKLLRDFIAGYGPTFQEAVQSRQRAFGSSEGGHIGDLPNSTVAASFISQMSRRDNYMGTFLTPPGLDLSPVLDHGNAVLFAWAGNYSPSKPMNQFSPRRFHRDTLFRFVVPVQ